MEAKYDEWDVVQGRDVALRALANRWAASGGDTCSLESPDAYFDLHRTTPHDKLRLSLEFDLYQPCERFGDWNDADGQFDTQDPNGDVG